MRLAAFALACLLPAVAWAQVPGSATSIPQSTLGLPKGPAQLDGNGILVTSQIPPVAGSTPLVSPAGALAAYSSSLYALYSTMPVLPSSTGPLYVARRDSDSATLTVTGTGNGYNSAAIAAWAGGSDVYVVTLYDLSGNGYALTQATTTAQAKLDLTGAYPVLHPDGMASYYPGATPLAGWLSGASGASVAVLRRNDTSNTSASHYLIEATTGTSSSAARLAMGVDNTALADVVDGRRLDTDALNRSGGFAPDQVWDAEIGRWNYAAATISHSTTNNGETRTFQTAGATSATAPQVLNLFSGPGTAFYGGGVAVVALYSSALTDVQSAGLTAALDGLIPAVSTTPASVPLQLDWGSAAPTGPYTLAAGLTNYTVDTPDGTTPAYSDLASLRYHHHTRIYDGANGLKCVAYSGAASGEEQGGQITELNCTSNNWTSSTGPQVVVPPQSTFQLTGAGDQVGSRISYPRAFVSYGGTEYVIAAIDAVNATPTGASSYQQGLALVAASISATGTIGTPFLISPAAYTPLSGVTAIAYSTTLGPPLYALAATVGTWGGSAPGQPASSWQGWALQGANAYVEPSAVALSADGTNLLRLWRKNGGNVTTYLYISASNDAGRTWSPIVRTNVPSAATEFAAMVLPSGLIVVAGNPQNVSGGTARDPLFLATFGGTTGKLCGVVAVRQGLPSAPTYPNGANGGAQYPGLATDGTNVDVSYSIAKQVIGETSVPITSLAACS